ncbi:hypothetical protein Tco_0962696 [Tanacetum coccineum]
MERGFLSQKGSGVVRSVKEKDLNVANRKTVKDGVIPPIIVDPNSIASNFEVVMNGVEPSAISASGNIQVENMGQSSSGPSLPTQDATSDINALGKSLEDTIVLGSFPQLPTQATTPAGNAPSKSSYANVTSKPSGKKLNIRTLFTPGGNGIDVVVPVESIRAISDRFDNTAYGFFLGKRVAYPVVANYVRTHGGLDTMLENGPWFIRNNPLILKKWHPDENLLKEDVSDVPGRSSFARVMIELRADAELKDNIVVVFGHIHEECPKNTSIGEKKTAKKPSQTSRGILVGPKLGFKPQKEYRPVSKKPTASSSGNKKKGVEPIIAVINSNPFEVLNSVDNDVEFGTNANLFEELFTSGQAILVDDAGNPLKKVEFLDDYNSEDEVASVDNDMARFLASEKVDPYDDDVYECQDLPQELQAICDNMYIRV